MPPQTLYTEIAGIEQAMNTFSTYFAFDPYGNQDLILRTKGKQRFAFYDQMVDADSVLAGLIDSRIDACAGIEWDIIPASQDESDVDISNFVREAIKGIDEFQDDLSDILRACVTGFSVSEIIWTNRDVDGEMRIVPEALLAKTADWFKFDQERKLRFLSNESKYEGVPVPDYKFIVHSFRKRNESPYGVSLLRSVYWPWWFKSHGYAEWMKAAERGAVGTIVMKYGPAANEEEQNELEEAAQKMLKCHYVVCKEDTQIEFPVQQIDSSFADILVSRCNDEMTYRILGAVLSSSTTESGTRALGEVHDLRFQERTEADSKSLAATLNKTLIKYIVDLNYPGVTQYPKWKQRYEQPKDVATNANTLKFALELGLDISKKTAADLLELPLAKEGEDLISLTTAPAPEQIPPETTGNEIPEEDKMEPGMTMTGHEKKKYQRSWGKP